MKKIIPILIAVILTFSLVFLTGCGGKTLNDTTTKNVTTSEKATTVPDIAQDITDALTNASENLTTTVVPDETTLLNETSTTTK